MEPFKKHVKAGYAKDKQGWIFVTIEWDGDRLSLTGVVGPKADGDARGSWGQIDLLEEIEGRIDGVDLGRLADVWKRWHLNDMRAGCAHQRYDGWDKRPIDPSKPTNTYGRHFEGQKQDSWNLLGWIRPDEHPDGLLGKPCDVCGYKYGTAWLHEDVPEDVLVFLSELPDDTNDALLPACWR